MRVSVDEKPQMTISAKSFIFVADNFKLKLFVVMVTLQYYDEIEKAVEVPSVITDLFKDVFSENDSDEEKMFCSVMLEVGLPVEKWIFYVITHEENAFKRWFDCKPDENDRRLSPKELFDCFRPLSDGNRIFLLGKLSDISDGVVNKLSKYVEEDDLVSFSNVINETDINTSSIATICTRVKAMIDCYYAVKQLYADIIEIIQNDNEDSMFRQMEKVINVFLSNFERVDNEQSTDEVVDYTNNFFEKLSVNGENKVVNDLTIQKYHFCIWFYYKILPVKLASSVALDSLEKLVFNPKYEKFWKDYEDDTRLEELDKEMENFLGFSEGEDEGKQDVLIASGWQLPDGFFEPAYIDDDCPLEEYFPEFLKDLIQFEGHNEQLDNPNAKLRKEGLKKLSNKFSTFIDNLASKNYIINDVDNKLALAHALTGRRVKSSVKNVKWSKPKTLGTKNDHINSICFLITWLYPSNISSLESGKYEHILTVFDGLEGTNPGNNMGVNVKRSPSKKIVKSFLFGLMECAPIVNKENLGLRMKEFEEKYGKN